MIRVIKIPGRSPAARRTRLQGVAAWMGQAGWELMDFAEGPGSALFERPPGKGPLPWLHPTRWLPGPGAFRPRGWLPTLRADPRLLALPVTVLGLAWLTGVLVLAPPDWEKLWPEAVEEAVEAEPELSDKWRVVLVNGLKVREGPGINHQVLGQLFEGQQVLVIESQPGWVRISKPERGYVAARYLR